MKLIFEQPLMNSEPIASSQRDKLFETLQRQQSKGYTRTVDFRYELEKVCRQVIETVDSSSSRETLTHQTNLLFGVFYTDPKLQHLVNAVEALHNSQPSLQRLFHFYQNIQSDCAQRLDQNTVMVDFNYLGESQVASQLSFVEALCDSPGEQYSQLAPLF